MYLIQMRPDELRDAVRKQLPLIIAAGVIEYHGPHLPLGTDNLIPQMICEIVERRCSDACVIGPSLPFGPTMSWAGGSEDGEMDFAPEPFFQYVREMLRHYVAMGFRRIYVMQYHQGSEGLQSLSIRKAAAEVLRETAERFGDGWGRARHRNGEESSLFNWIQVAGLDTFSDYESSDLAGRMPIGHAGKGETQLIMASYPDTVRMDLLDSWEGELPEWLDDAALADLDEGRYWLAFCVEGWVCELLKKKSG